MERPDTQPVASPLDPMDLLEHAVRTYEEFIGVAFPESDVVLFVADLIPGGASGHGLIASNSASDAYTISNGTAYIWDVTPNWLVGSTRWIIAGAEFLTDISERDRLDGPLPEPESSCSLGNNIADLVRLEPDSGVIYSSACNYILGRGIFWELYHGLGDTAFRQGFRNLHLMGTGDVPAWYREAECAVRDAGLCYFKATFLFYMTPQQQAIAEEIIARRYFGASP